jgi:hypothetical protein
MASRWLRLPVTPARLTSAAKFVNFANRAKGAGRPSHNAQDLIVGGKLSG